MRGQTMQLEIAGLAVQLRFAFPYNDVSRIKMQDYRPVLGDPDGKLNITQIYSKSLPMNILDDYNEKLIAAI